MISVTRATYSKNKRLDVWTLNTHDLIVIKPCVKCLVFFCIFLFYHSPIKEHFDSIYCLVLIWAIICFSIKMEWVITLFSYFEFQRPTMWLLWNFECNLGKFFLISVLSQISINIFWWIHFHMQDIFLCLSSCLLLFLWIIVVRLSFVRLIIQLDEIISSSKLNTVCYDKKIWNEHFLLRLYEKIEIRLSRADCWEWTVQV